MHRHTAFFRQRSWLPLGSVAVVAVPVFLLLSGCANYKVTQSLSRPIPAAAECRVGVIVDQLPAEIDPDDRPTEDEIGKLRSQLETELRKVELIQVASAFADSLDYEVTGGILAFRRGSGAVRFFIGFGLGDAEVLAELRLVDLATGESIFAGNFKGKVSSGMESGDQAYQQIARGFANALEDEIVRINKER